MKKIRCYLVTIALVASLSGPALLGLASGSNAASSWLASSISSSFVAGKSTKLEAYKGIKPPCGVPGANDC